MSDGTIVFMGPSLRADRARAELDADYRPPVRLGDVVRAVDAGARTIAIIDGLFDGTPPVWHKEILHALAEGVAVYGGSSMGALRAAELHTFGMRGVGEVFASFRDGELEDDDEVAVVHGAGPEYQALSEAMVNLRHGLELAVRADVLDVGARDRLVERSKVRHYRDRSWDALREDAEALLPPPAAAALAAFLERSQPDLKRDDALAVLRAIAADRAAGREPEPVSFTLEPTLFWEKLKQTTAGPGDGTVRDEDLRRAVMTSPQGRQVGTAALGWYLIEQEALRLGMEPSPQELREYKGHFRRIHGLDRRDDVTRWIDDNDVDADDFDELARWHWRADRLQDLLSPHLRRSLFLELKRSGQYAHHRQTLEAMNATLRRLGLERPTLEESSVSAAELLAWYQRRVVVTEPDLVSHARRLRFDLPTELVQHLLRVMLYERATAES